jgi:hypothetical protein
MFDQLRYASIFVQPATPEVRTGRMCKARMAVVIRVAWMAIFLLGTAALAWLEWRSSEPSTMAWFLFTGVWSAVCGIGYTVMHWFKLDRTSRPVGVRPGRE